MLLIQIAVHSGIVDENNGSQFEIQEITFPRDLSCSLNLFPKNFIHFICVNLNVVQSISCLYCFFARPTPITQASMKKAGILFIGSA